MDEREKALMLTDFFARLLHEYTLDYTKERTAHEVDHGHMDRYVGLKPSEDPIQDQRFKSTVDAGVAHVMAMMGVDDE